MEYFPATLTAEESADLLDRIRDEFSTEGFGPYAVERLSDGELLGFTGLHRVTFSGGAGGPGRNPLAAAARRLGTGLRHRGGRACVAFAAKLGIPELVAFAFVGNERSRARDAEDRHGVRRGVQPPCPARGASPAAARAVPHPDPVKKKSAALDRPRTSRLRARAISVRSPPCREYRPKRRPHKP